MLPQNTGRHITPREWPRKVTPVLLMQVWLPHRLGALGAVASALGVIGADITLVEIVEKRGDVEVDEFILDLPPHQSVMVRLGECCPESVRRRRARWG